MRITSKGQVTIPKPVRQALNLEPGDQVQFRIESDRVVLERLDGKAKRNAADELIRGLEDMGCKLDRIPMTTDELMALTRGPFDDLDAH